MNESEEARLYAPIILLQWIPQTILAILAVYHHIMWQYFGIKDGINTYYTERYSSSYDMYMGMVGEIGIFGIIVFLLVCIGYAWMTYILWIAYIK